jgi:hypothetical protein
MERRQFLQWGTATIVGVAVLGACTGDDGGNHPQGAPPPPTTAVTNPTGAGPSDLALTRTAASLEAMLVATYQAVVSSTLLTNPALLTIGNTFSQHHTAHLAALNGILTASGAPAITAPNDAMEKQIVQPALAAAKTQDDLMHLVFTLEDATAQTYVYAGGAATRPDLRSSVMTIGGIEARHRAILGVEIENLRIEDLFPGSFMDSANPLPPDAFLA